MTTSLTERASIDGDLVRRLFRTMALIREFETTGARLMASGTLPGFLHVSIGQEGVAAGVCDALERDDYITSTHRGHGHCIAKGGELGGMMAELYGRQGGYCAGRSGSMHIADPSVGILGANAIVGAGIPIAVGGAFSARARGSGQVAVAFFGEGAVAEGVFHESLNIAALWQLPVVFVCENNMYAEMTHIAAHLATKDVADLAAPYGIPGAQIDGNDVFAVRAATAAAVERARAGDGPTLIECKTYRWHGHFEGDPQRYRDKAEVETWRKADPLVRLTAAVREDEDLVRELEAITEEVRDAVRSAVSWAESSPYPGPSSISADVYRDPSPFVSNSARWRQQAAEGRTE